MEDELLECSRSLVQLCKAGRTAKCILRELRKEGFSDEVIHKSLDNMR